MSAVCMCGGTMKFLYREFEWRLYSCGDCGRRQRSLGTSLFSVTESIERARQAQQEHERRTDVQLEIPLTPDAAPGRVDEQPTLGELEE